MQQSFISQEQREAAALRYKLMRQVAEISAAGPISTSAVTTPTPGGVPDYFGPWANWAYSPLLRKFVDTLPGVGPGNANNLGNYIGQGHPDTVTYPGSDYYEIELREYEQQLHSDMPPTRLRGYVQVNKGTDASNNNTIEPDPISYLGPFISATKDRPVRIKFTNKLPIGAGGDLFIPVDTTVMGAGMGPLGMDAMPMNYTQTRATLHLHGGITPWISDGTPHQWITPANEDTPYPEGVSVSNVPDMPDPGDGSMTFFYTNQQSARLMWVHDHSFGITRLNVYVGEAMPYEITDDIEKQLIADGIIPGPADTVPLIVQDKTFVDADTILQTDPTWNWGTTAPVPHTGDLWMPHVYVPAQNPADPGGMNATGRWHYGPWFWPPTSDITHPPIPNPYYNSDGSTPWEYPLMPATPNPSMGMESFFDTPLVNGTAYPTVEVDPKTYRFRVLNAANDRFFNLQLYLADPTTLSADGRALTEVKMVPAVPTAGFPETWPTDGREGGAPDPATAGPEWVQIGNESGFLPMPAVIPQQPVTWNGDPTTFNMGNVQDHSLLVAPAERADVLVDFSAYAGQTLILYNDAPTAFPALDPRTDYYTGAPDMTDT
ncbi:laccase, partial [bacterium]|nr:laccase [bacterium]